MNEHTPDYHDESWPQIGPARQRDERGRRADDAHSEREQDDTSCSEHET